MRTRLLPIAFAILACCGHASEPYLATQQRPFARGDTYHLALASGRLILRSGCIAIESRLPDGGLNTRTLVFPHGYRLKEREGRWQVMDTKSRQRARLGEPFEGGGGEISRPPEGPGGLLEARIGKEAIARCQGPYFAVNPTDDEIRNAPERRD